MSDKLSKKFLTYLNKANLDNMNTLPGVVLTTVTLCKKIYKGKCNRDIIKESVTHVLDKLMKERKLGSKIEANLNTISSEEIYELIDDFYTSYDCFMNLKKLLCKTRPTMASTHDTHPIIISEPTDFKKEPTEITDV